jgi:hypothetical protein
MCINSTPASVTAADQDVVKVFDLTHLNASLVLGVVTFDCRRVRAALVDRDFLSGTVIPGMLNIDRCPSAMGD